MIYANFCGWTLARAHARSGDPIAMAAYLGGRSGSTRPSPVSAKAMPTRTSGTTRRSSKRSVAAGSPRRRGCERRVDRPKEEVDELIGDGALILEVRTSTTTEGGGDDHTETAKGHGLARARAFFEGGLVCGARGGVAAALTPVRAGAQAPGRRCQVHPQGDVGLPRGSEDDRTRLRQRHRDHHAAAGEDPVRQLRRGAAQPARQAARAAGGRLFGRGALFRRQDGQHPRQARQRLPAVRRPGERGSAGRGDEGRAGGRAACRRPAPVECVRGPRGRGHGGQAHRPRRRRRRGVRAPRLPQFRHGLAALGGGRRSGRSRARW